MNPIPLVKSEIVGMKAERVGKHDVMCDQHNKVRMVLVSNL